MYQRVRRKLWGSILLFVEKDGPSRGAAISFYTVTSIAPVLLIVIAVAGAVFGRDAARGAIVRQLTGLLGRDAAELLQAAVVSASQGSGSTIATVVSAVTVFLAASGLFSEVQAALNALWDAKPNRQILSRMVQARAASFGLVLAIGFLMIVSLVLDAAVTAASMAIGDQVPFVALGLQAVTHLFSFALTSVLFAAIYRVLPYRTLGWYETMRGAVLTAALFEVGKFLIGLYLGGGNANSSLGAAGALLGLLFWVYYSAMIFLFGAALMRGYFEDPKSPATQLQTIGGAPVPTAE